MRRLLTLLLLCPPLLLADPVIIGHAGIEPLDLRTLQRIYTGKVVEVSGMRVNPVNLPPGHRLRERFLTLYLGQSDDKYIGYWTVRRYVGKGTPPRELDSVEDIIRYVKETPGAMGYIDEDDLPDGVTALIRTP